MLDFAVFALPRSGTAWVANWLTTDKSLCLHDPFAYGLPEDWPRDNRKRGIACTGGYAIPAFVETLDCPIAVIDRPGRVRLPGLAAWLARVRGKRWRFEDLWDEHRAAELAAFLCLEFDPIRYRLLRGLNVQINTNWTWDPAVLGGLRARGWLPPGE